MTGQASSDVAAPLRTAGLRRRLREAVSPVVVGNREAANHGHDHAKQIERSRGRS